jgi:hypothetical protein
MSVSDLLKYFGYAILAGVIGTIVFVRPSQLGGENGGIQASRIINSTFKGMTDIITASTGGKVN